MAKLCAALGQIPAVPNYRQVSCFQCRRLFFPRYDIRNNRGVGHVGGDVDANHMDAEAVQAMATWVMAELVRIFHNVTSQEARETIDALVERKTPLIWEMEGAKRVLDAKMTAKEKVLTLLQHSADWVSENVLRDWVEYSNASAFRTSVLKPLHKKRLIEFDAAKARVRISPVGAKEVEQKLTKKS